LLREVVHTEEAVHAEEGSGSCLPSLVLKRAKFGLEEVVHTEVDQDKFGLEEDHAKVDLD